MSGISFCIKTGCISHSYSSAANSRTHSRKRAVFLNGDYPIGNKISEKKLIYGRYLNDSDVSENKNVVVIGEQIYKTLFEAGENPIGKSINIKGLF